MGQALPFTAETARAMALRSVEARKAKALKLKELAQLSARSFAAQTGITLVPGPDASRSRIARDKLGQVVIKQIEALQKEKRDLAGVRGEQGLAAVTKTVAETAALVFDWKSQSQGNTINMDLLKAASATVETDEPTQTQKHALPEGTDQKE